MSELIGITGFKESGKDTTYRILAEFLEEYFQPHKTVVVRDAFADRLKLSAFRCFKPDATLEEAVAWADAIKKPGAWITDGREQEVFNGKTLAYHLVTGRQFLQHYGTEAHRQVFDPDFWIKAVLPGDDPLNHFGRPDAFHFLVITDPRFPNEAQAIRDRGGKVWEVLRPGKGGDGHASEQPLPRELVDYQIRNYGDLDYLRQEVELAFRSSFPQYSKAEVTHV